MSSTLSQKRALGWKAELMHDELNVLQTAPCRGCLEPCCTPCLFLHSHSRMLLQVLGLRALEWKNILNVREIHTTSFFRASPTVFIDWNKNTTWILLENIWPLVVKGLFKESCFFFCSSHCYLTVTWELPEEHHPHTVHLLQMLISQHIVRQDNVLSTVLNNTSFCPFHTFQLCPLNCFTKVNTPCPLLPHKGTAAISKSSR